MMGRALLVLLGLCLVLIFAVVQLQGKMTVMDEELERVRLKMRGDSVVFENALDMMRMDDGECFR